MLAQVVNSLILTVKNTAIFAMKFSKSVSLMKLSQISEIGTGRISS